jgi:hypothetical protein
MKPPFFLLQVLWFHLKPLPCVDMVLPSLNDFLLIYTILASAQPGNNFCCVPRVRIHIYKLVMKANSLCR